MFTLEKQIRWIDVGGNAWMTMPDDGKSSDYEVLNLVGVE